MDRTFRIFYSKIYRNYFQFNLILQDGGLLDQNCGRIWFEQFLDIQFMFNGSTVSSGKLQCSIKVFSVGFSMNFRLCSNSTGKKKVKCAQKCSRNEQINKNNRILNIQISFVSSCSTSSINTCSSLRPLEITTLTDCSLILILHLAFI